MQMVGTASFRLRFRGTSHCLTTVFLAKSNYSSPHPYFIQVIGKPHVASPVLFQSRSRSYQANASAEASDSAQLSGAFKRSVCHTNSCMERGLELRCPTIWHGLLPSHHRAIPKPSTPSKSNSSNPSTTTSSSSFLCSPSREQAWHGPAFSRVHANSATASWPSHFLTRGLSLPHDGGVKRDAMASNLLDGSWNAAWDARPARWLHGRNSAWLLFGACSCFSTLSSISASPSTLSTSLSCLNEKLDDNQHEAADVSANLEVVLMPNPLLQRKPSVKYTIIEMPSDGRCLFRAITYGASLRSGKPTVSDALQQELAADELRNKVVDELVSRRGESEWFIEEDFDTYVERMRQPYIWGGEPELLMASHVLKMPITVHLLDKTSGDLISVAEYGKEYGVENPIRVLYHGFGHYDALQFD